MKEKPTPLSDSKVLGLQFLLYIVMLLTLLLVLPACNDTCEVKQQYTYFEPVYMGLDELRSSVTVEPSRRIQSGGKIFFKDNLLFINEPNEGIHIINNQDPSNPQLVSFIKVPGSFDIAVHGSYLYTDSYIDLVIIDIQNIQEAKEVGRVENVFNGYNSYGFYVDDQLGLVTDWALVEEVTITESSCKGGDVYAWGRYYDGGIALAEAASFDSRAAVSPTNPGIAGSLTRFTVTHDHLYVIESNMLVPFDLNIPYQPLKGNQLALDWGIETLFPSGDQLFVGAQNGMHILDLTNPESPSLLSTYTHVNSCDPVVVDGSYAYVTLRSGNACAGFTDQLEIIDIADLTNPTLIHTYPMYNPHGLGKDGDILFICDGSEGLKVYDAADVSKIDSNMLAHYSEIQALDIIPFNKTAMVIGEDGLYQYDYSDLNAITLLSHIRIQR